MLRNRFFSVILDFVFEWKGGFLLDFYILCWWSDGRQMKQCWISYIGNKKNRKLCFLYKKCSSTIRIIYPTLRACADTWTHPAWPAHHPIAYRPPDSARIPAPSPPCSAAAALRCTPQRRPHQKSGRSWRPAFRCRPPGSRGFHTACRPTGCPDVLPSRIPVVNTSALRRNSPPRGSQCSGLHGESRRRALPRNARIFPPAGARSPPQSLGCAKLSRGCGPVLERLGPEFQQHGTTAPLKF